MRSRVVADGSGGWTLVDNTRYRPRAASRIERLLADVRERLTGGTPMSDPFSAIAASGSFRSSPSKTRATRSPSPMRCSKAVSPSQRSRSAQARRRETLSALKSARPELLIGAGTVLDLGFARGGDRAPAPSSDSRLASTPKSSKRRRSCGLPFAPGVMTPSELGAAVRRASGWRNTFQPARPADPRRSTRSPRLSPTSA